jgi:hypothetical protein
MLFVPLSESSAKRLGLVRLDHLLDKIPRPERSGTLSVVISLVLLFTSLSPVGIETGKFTWCKVLGLFSLPCPASDQAGDDSKYRPIAYVYFGPEPGHGGKRPCSCHIDFRSKNGPIEHWHSKIELTCDTYPEWSSPADGLTWTNETYIGRDGSLVPDLSEVRWHCTEDDAKESVQLREKEYRDPHSPDRR